MARTANKKGLPMVYEWGFMHQTVSGGDQYA